MNNMKPL